MEIGNKDKESQPQKNLRSELIGVNRTMRNFCGFVKECKQYLPDFPMVPLMDTKKNVELVAVQTLRADSLVIPRKSDHNLRENVRDPDFINIPSSFIMKDSYIVLLIPRYYDPDYTRIASYDITVLKCVNNQQLVKLPGENESRYRARWNNFRANEGQLIETPLLDDSYRKLLSIEIKDDKEDSVNIWLGEMEIIRKEDVYKTAVNGTVCYRMIEGKVEKERQRKEKRAPNFVPQIASA